ncbi:acyl carrier protein [Streptomyces albus subsp. chlorinus]|uniref:acyl carrier protein n=1 Tax=Streptomyces albus TaxID=1888 RepID=UPI00156E2EC8|nr:acyl carrier protein [Streptomyces albus]NSC25217.1 acyl carrier protein [Streptomyces albus subsp. chlorinus]
MTGQPASGELDMVRSAVESVLGVPVAPDTDFFGAGGDSLKAIDLVDRLRADLDVQLDYVDVFDHPTPAQLVRFADSLRSGGA